jgi:glycerol kinase
VAVKNRFYLGIDQGTTGTTCMVFDDAWNVCSKGYAEHTQYYPMPGWVEHDPLEIWEKTKESVALALNQAGITARDIRVIGQDNQGETCMIWDKKTGMPIYNAIVWQDRRTAKEADRLKAKWGDVIQKKTGVQVDAYFSALKLKWILDHVETAWSRLANGELLLGTLDTWLTWKMTAGAVYTTDPSTASRTMLFNLHTKTWDDEILKIMGIPKAVLPKISESIAVVGLTAGSAFFDVEIPIAGSVVDQAAALFGQTCFQEGSVKTTYGTGCFMLMNTGNRPIYSKNGLLTTAVWSMGDDLTYALDGGVYITGAAIQWLRDGIQIIDSAAETEAIAQSVPDTGGVYFVPAFVGLAAPYWDQYARGTLVGITGGTTRAHLVRATLEATAFQVAENLEVMRTDSGMAIDGMRVDGGAVVNKFLMQLQADILGIPVDVPEIYETSAFGAALLAALGIGDIQGLDEIAVKWKLARRYEPSFSEDRRQALCARWKEAVQRSRQWAESE